MYPLKFTKVLKEKVWGGREFESFLGVALEPGKTFGESWEVSAHPNGPSVVENGPWAGRTLPELTTTEGAQLVGRSLHDKFGATFPLLIKYLDVHDKLSIQVHPDDEYALAHEGEFGKSECWYILKASPDARLILGMEPGVTRQDFAEKSRRGDWTGLFRETPVAAGDFLHITPGTVHASLTGSVLLCEIQQNSDTTYRIYDFDRLENGKKRPLHLDKALDVIHFGEDPKHSHAGDRPRRQEPGAVVEPLVADPHYTVDRLEVTGVYAEAPEDRFRVYSILEVEGRLVCEGQSFALRAGDTWLIPANLPVSLEGKLVALRSVA